MAINKIIWVLPQKKYDNSGISKYNYNLINIVKKNMPLKKSILKVPIILFRIF